MAIYRGLNVSLNLGDVDNLAESLTNLGLNINDLDRIRGLSNSITTQEFHLLGQLTTDQEKETYSAYRSSAAVGQRLLTLADIYNSTYDANAIINNQLRAAAVKYNFIQYREQSPYFTIENADISTSRVSSWSSLVTPANTDVIFYGADLQINPIANTNQACTAPYADQTESVIVTDSIKFKGPITEKRFEAEETTNQVLLYIDGNPYYFYAMQNIPLSFDAFFRNSGEVVIQTEIGTNPTLVILDKSTDPESEYVFTNLPATSIDEYRFTTNSLKRLDLYARPDTFLFLQFQRMGISSFPSATLNGLTQLDLRGNTFNAMPNFASRTPNLTILTMSGCPLTAGTLSAQDNINNLPTSLTKLFVDACFTDGTSMDLSTLTSLERFDFNGFFDNEPIKNPDFGFCPIVNSSSIQTYNVRSQQYNFVNTQLMGSTTLLNLDLFGNRIRGLQGGGNLVYSINPGTLNIRSVNLSASGPGTMLCVPIPHGGDTQNTACTTLVTYNHSGNAGMGQSTNIDLSSITNTGSSNTHGYFENCISLRFVDLSGTFVYGNFEDTFRNNPSLEVLNLQNTNMSGTFVNLAQAANIILGGDNGTVDTESEAYQQASQFVFTSLTEFVLTSTQNFNSFVDTSSNFFGNDLETVIVSFNPAYYNSHARIENLSAVNNLDTVTVRFEKNSTLRQYPYEAGSGNSWNDEWSVSQSDFYNDIPGMGASDYGEFSEVSVHVRTGDLDTTPSEAKVVIADDTASYISGSPNYTVQGAVGRYRGDGNFETALVPVVPATGQQQLSFFGIIFQQAIQVPHTGYGKSLAQNDTHIFVGFPGMYETNNQAQSGQNAPGGVCVFRRDISSQQQRLERSTGPARINFGEKMVADNDAIFVMDNGANHITRYNAIPQGSTFRYEYTTNPLTSSSVGSRTFTQMKQSDNYVVVGSVGNTSSTSGRVWAIKKSDNSVTVIQPTSTAPTTATQTLHDQNFGTAIAVQDMPDGNTVIAISSPINDDGDANTSPGYGSTVELYFADSGSILTGNSSLGFANNATGNAQYHMDYWADDLTFHTYYPVLPGTPKIILTHHRNAFPTGANARRRPYEITSGGYTANTYSDAPTTGNAADWIEGHIGSGSDQSQAQTAQSEVEQSSPVFRMLPVLDTFELGGSKTIGGKLPDTGELGDARVFKIIGTSLSGTIDLNLASDLVTVDLSDNSFSGALPTVNLSNLVNFNVRDNQLTSVGDFNSPNLATLDLSQNQIAGQLPDLSTCTQLQDVKLGFNLFNAYPAGILATALSLRILELQNNSLTLQDGFRILDDMVTNFDANNRSGVIINLLGNTLITEAAINANSTYAGKISYLRNTAGWTVNVN